MAASELDASDRHPSTAAIVRHFSYEHLPPGLREVSQHIHSTAELMLANLKDGPELVAGLRKLLEAKDCFVRQALVDQASAGPLAHD